MVSVTLPWLLYFHSLTASAKSRLSQHALIMSYLPMSFLCAWQLSLICCGWSSLLQSLMLSSFDITPGSWELCSSPPQLCFLSTSSSLILLGFLCINLTQPLTGRQISSMKRVLASSLEFMPNYVFVQCLILLSGHKILENNQTVEGYCWVLCTCA